ncbi:hypothetical protein QAD02_016646 [Eretmocerus hayati]|uniref:Uncharacterized protein n=1 Tax=Eretmocerus hayati TaxID=131215 RepID=A0ACC2PB77_9HYME|nr:hypothetical protein QAD02_016646 [Eretmocerus hayati]
MLFNYMVLMMELVRSITTRQRLIELWDSIQVFDESLQLLLEYDKTPSKRGFPESQVYKSMIIQFQRCLWEIFAISTIGWTFVNVSGMMAFDEPYLHNIGYMTPYVFTFIAALKFCGLAYLISQRLDRLVDYASHKTTRTSRESCMDDRSLKVRNFH